MRELYRSDHYVIEVDDVRRVVCRRRTPRGYESLEDLVRSQEEAIRAMNTIVRRSYAQLIDLCLAPPRNDPGFERTLARYRAPLNDGFRALAYLVRTEAGRLQLARMGHHAGGQLRVFLDEREALAYLTG